MPRIDAYEFGQIRIEGETYHSDVIIYPDRIDDRWWRKEGHSLHIEDLSEVLRERPEVLVVGTGRHGMMRVPQETMEHVTFLGIQLIAEDTGKACETFNRMAAEKRVIAALHLSC